MAKEPVRRRPPIGDKAMTSAERAAKYRAARRAGAVSRSAVRRAEHLTDAQLIDALRLAVAAPRPTSIWLLTEELRTRYPSS